MTVTMNEVVSYLEEQDDFVLISHDHPDGDTLGSAAALLMALHKRGKRASWVCGDPLPFLYDAMPGGNLLQLPSQLNPQEMASAVLVDCAQNSLFQKSSSFFLENSLCIDHHPSNQGYAKYTYCEPKAAATGEIVLDLIHRLFVGIDAEMATCLLYAISTDTGHFSHGNTTEKTLSLAAELIACGADIHKLSVDVYRRKEYSAVKLLGKALDTLTMVANGRGAFLYVTREDFCSVGADTSQTEGIVDYAQNIHTVCLSAFMREIGADVPSYKVSLRSDGSVDVGRLAAEQGGGGHAAAAGFSLQMSFQEAKDQVLSMIKEALHHRLGSKSH